MTSTGFYVDQAEPSFGEQMDPLGTAAQAERAPEKTAQAPPVTIGKAKVKKKMSTRKKVAIGAGGFLAAFLALVLALDSPPPTVNASPKPQTAIPATANPGQMLGVDAATSTTVMGGAPAPAVPEAADQAKAVVDAAAPGAAAPATASTAAPALAAAPAPVGTPVGTVAAPPSAPAGAATVAPAPAPAPTVGAPTVPAPEAAKSPGKPQAVAKAEIPTATSEQLASRVTALERRLARYERVEAQVRARSGKETAVRLKPVAAEKVQPVAQPIVEAKKLVALANDTVRVIGVSTRHGVTIALVDFGGVKSRVSQGDSIPGLGTVQSVAVDAAGNPVVEINGFSYR